MKRETEKSHQQIVNEVIDYIQSHLHERLCTEKLAQRFCLSPYHFHRILRAHLREPLSTYITRQRLERAVLYLQVSEMKLVQLAELVGYQTPQALAKAFRNQFGVTPSEYQKRLNQQRTHHRQAHTAPVARLIEEPDMHLVYIRIIGPYGDPESYNRAWKKLTAYLMARCWLTSETRWIGLSFDDPHVTDPEHCRFYACATVPAPAKPYGEFGSRTLAARKYAVYTHVGPYSELQAKYDAIYSHFPCPLQGAEVFEEYLPIREGDKQLVTRIYIPVLETREKKKQKDVS